MSKNTIIDYIDELLEAMYNPYWEKPAADKTNRKTTRKNRKKHRATASDSHTRDFRTKNTVDQAQNSEPKKNNDVNEPGNVDQEKKTSADSVSFLQELNDLANKARTENGAKAYKSSGSDVLDLFSCIGAIRHLKDLEIQNRFYRAWAEDRDLTMKLLFYARDIRGGLGERRVFRTILRSLADQEPESVKRNIELIPFYGRYDDLLELLETSVEKEVLDFIRQELEKDTAALAAGKPVSLLAKWLPSVNASSEETRKRASRVARGIGMSDKQYRHTLSALRASEHILENNLRLSDYNFDYSGQPSRAMLKYRMAFLRNDRERYTSFLRDVNTGKASLHTSGLMPYELVSRVRTGPLDSAERKIMDVTWNALEDYTEGRNALAVVDVSNSMTWITAGIDGPRPIDVAVSLGLYFAERNKGAFRNYFISFSEVPNLIEVKGKDLADKVRYCMTAPWNNNTNIQAVFELILNTALKNSLPQSELPETLYIISDMEFDSCTCDADLSSFEYAKGLFEAHGYQLPQVIFWNVQSRNKWVPVRMNEQGVAMISGCSSRIFSLVAKARLDILDPLDFMISVLGSERYAPIRA